MEKPQALVIGLPVHFGVPLLLRRESKAYQHKVYVILPRLFGTFSYHIPQQVKQSILQYSEG